MLGQIIVICVILSLLAVWGASWLWSHYSRVGRRLDRIITSLDAYDTTLRFPLTHDRRINKSLNRIADRLSELSRRAAERDCYYEAIISQIATGVLVIDSKNYVVFANERALTLLDRPAITNVTALGDRWKGLYDFILTATPGLSAQIDRFAVKTSSFSRQDGEPLMIVTLDDISLQLEAKSVDTWVEMSRVLTHEIMNGIAPVLSITDSLMMRYDGGEEYMLTGLRTVNEATEGLKNFVERYNRFTRVARPVPEEFDICSLVDRCIAMSETMTDSSLKFTVDRPIPHRPVYADIGQIQQVIMNLMKNAIEAGASTIGVNISFPADSNMASMVIENDGEPIPDDLQAHIFTPFFTTKTTGSGIGLSLSRRIMKENGGTLTLVSGSAVTRFLLSMPVA